ncbi:hypothetical protein DL93DRAFT_2233709 [Clavulina sp. PMI_390]|nr:hypothetical protein DL93DRAFT_2233709 [Clavulina sp. PMI_390]
MSGEAMLKTIIAAAPGIRDSNFIFVSMATWFIWDWIVSIDLEIQHFWGKKAGCIFTSPIGELYAWLHFYIALRVQNTVASSEICKPIIYTILVLTGVGTFIVQTVLVLRTYALWNCHKGIFWFLMSLNILGSLAQQGVVAIIWHGNVMKVAWNPLPAPYTGCVVLYHLPPWQRYVPILAFELGVLFFLVMKFVEYVREGRSHRLLYVLFRDGFIEFIAVSISSLLSLLIAIIGNGSEQSSHLTSSTFSIVSAVSTVCCARLLLNIRDVMALSDPLDTTKPNPWSLSPSFDERFGDVHDSHAFVSTAGPSHIDMFDTFFRNSESASGGEELVGASLARDNTSRTIPGGETFGESAGEDFRCEGFTKYTALSPYPYISVFCENVS